VDKANIDVRMGMLTTWTKVKILKIFSQFVTPKNLALVTQNTVIGFPYKGNCFVENTENSDHNIGPRSLDYHVHAVQKIKALSSSDMSLGKNFFYVHKTCMFLPAIM
jgi:hypothetical protein